MPIRESACHHNEMTLTLLAINHNACRDAQTVLVDLNQYFVSNEVQILVALLHGRNVVAQQEGRLDDTPPLEMSLLLCLGHATIADLQHVRVVPTLSGTHVDIVEDRVLSKVLFHTGEVVADVASCPPH